MRSQRDALVAATGEYRDLAVTARLIEEWLRAKLGVPRVNVSELCPPVGAGVSNETLLFEGTWEEGSVIRRRRMVLRIKPSAVQLFPDPDFEGQYRLLDTLHRERLVRVPEMYWLEEDPSVLGAPFLIMSRLEGRVPISSPVYNSTGWLFDATPSQRRVLWTSAVEELARIHLVPAAMVDFMARPELGATAEDQQLVYWARYSEWCTRGEVPDDVEAMGDWIRGNRPHDDRLGLSWGDARIGNMMFGEDYRLVGVMDWEQMSLAGARHDLGWWLFFDDHHSRYQGVARLDGLGNRRETIELWESLTGESAGDLTWYEAFAGYKLALISLRTMLLAGQPKERAWGAASAMIGRARAVAEIAKSAGGETT